MDKLSLRQLTEDRAYEIYDKFVDDISKAKTTAEMDKVRDNFIRDIFNSPIKPEQDDVETMELCPKCMAKHVIRLSEHGGIPI